MDVMAIVDSGPSSIDVGPVADSGPTRGVCDEAGDALRVCDYPSIGVGMITSACDDGLFPLEAQQAFSACVEAATDCTAKEECIEPLLETL